MSIETRGILTRAWFPSRSALLLALWRWLLALLLLGSLPILLHGCHGDDDNELFVRTKAPILTRAPARDAVSPRWRFGLLCDRFAQGQLDFRHQHRPRVFHQLVRGIQLGIDRGQQLLVLL